MSIATESDITYYFNQAVEQNIEDIDFHIWTSISIELHKSIPDNYQQILDDLLAEIK